MKKYLPTVCFVALFTGDGHAALPHAAAGSGCHSLPRAGEVCSRWCLLWDQAAATSGAPVPTPWTTSTSHAAGQRRHPNAAPGQGGTPHALRKGVPPSAPVQEGGPTDAHARQRYGSQERER